MEEHSPERRLGERDYASYVLCSIPKAVYCNVVPAQRNFRNQLKSLSIHGLGKSKLLFSLSVVFFTYAPYTPSLENIQSRVAQLIRLTIDSFRKDSARHTSKSSLEILPQSSSIISNRLILPTENWRIYRSTLKLSPWFKVPEQANHAC